MTKDRKFIQTGARTVVDIEHPSCETEWDYNCGWRIKGTHPYRPGYDFCDLSQPIGLLCFYKETGIFPRNAN